MTGMNYHAQHLNLRFYKSNEEEKGRDPHSRQRPLWVVWRLRKISFAFTEMCLASCSAALELPRNSEEVLHSDSFHRVLPQDWRPA